MRSTSRQDLPVAIANGRIEVGVLDQDSMSVGFVRLPAGGDPRLATPATGYPQTVTFQLVG